MNLLQQPKSLTAERPARAASLDGSWWYAPPPRRRPLMMLAEDLIGVVIILVLAIGALMVLP